MLNVNAKTLLAVSLAQSNEKTRRYLNGVHFQPGVMVATDGNILTAAQCDYDGEPLILPVSKKTQTGCKNKTADQVTWDGQTLQVLTPNGEVLHMEPVRAIDGTFPDWRRVLPAPDGLQDIGGNFSIIVMGKLNETAKAVGAHCFRHTAATSGPCLVKYGSRGDLFSVAMPTRAPNDFEIPGWVHQSTGGKWHDHYPPGLAQRR